MCADRWDLLNEFHLVLLPRESLEATKYPSFNSLTPRAFLLIVHVVGIFQAYETFSVLQLCRVERCSLKWCRGGKKLLNNRFCGRHPHAKIWHLVKSSLEGAERFFTWGCVRWETLYKGLRVVSARFVLVNRRLNHKTAMLEKVHPDVRDSMGKSIQPNYSAFGGTQLF